MALVLCAALLCIGAAAADSEDAIEIDTPEELAKIGVDKEYPLDGNYILTADIDLGGDTNPWNPIGTFTGTFDGAGHTISGLYIAGDSSADGNDRGLSLFSCLGSGGTITNLTVDGKIDPEDCHGSFGGIVGENDGTVSNCISDVDIKNTTVYAEGIIGGVVASAEDGSTVENCRYTGTIDVTYNKNNNSMGMGGVVGQASDCTIRNCENAGTVQTNIWKGGIVGRNNGGAQVLNCRNSGIVESNNPAAGAGSGGIVGDNYGVIRDSYNASTGIVTGGSATGGVTAKNAAENGGATCIVENCYNAGTVRGSGDVGGVVGHNNSSVNGYTATVKSSYNTGTVINDGSGNVGGVIGVIESGSVSDCYNTGAVTAIGGYAGGVAGFNGYSGYSIGTVESCYNIGTVRVESEGSGSAGGVVGYNQPGSDLEHIGKVTDCFYLKQDELKGIGAGNSTQTEVTPLSESDFGDPETYDETGLDFTDTWIIDTPSEGGFARPMLRYNLETAEGSGTESDPYIIPDLETLEFYRGMINAGSDSKYNSAHYKLTVDINLDGSEDNQWEPIGGSKNRAFTGTFDGNGHTISGLYINNGDSVYAGLFGYVGRGGMIKGLTVEGKITISGSTSCVGGIAGFVDGTEVSEMSVLTDSDDSKTGIIDCTSNVTINVTYNGLSVGGIVGSCGGATISGCKNCGDVSVVGTSESGIDINIGGIVGYSGSSTIIRNCCNTGAVSVQDAEKAYAGGVMGQSINTTLSGCYNIGAVSVQNTEDAALGGVVGQSAENTAVSSCYNTGAVSAENAEYANLGGVVGENRSGSVISSYNTGAVSGGANTGGVVGFNSKGTVGNCYNTGDVSAEDVEYAAAGGVVGRNSSGAVNDCYNTGDVSGKASSGASAGDSVMAGGVVGYNSSGTVNDCYNTGDVSGKASSGASAGDPVMAGGVVGYNDGGKVTNCYNIGTVSGENTEDVSVGGVAGYKDSGAVSSCYYLEQGNLPGIGNDVGNDGAFPLTKDQFSDTDSFFTGWNFNDTWTISDMGGFERPVLRDNKETVVTYTVTVNGSYAGETGAGSYLAGESVTVSAGERAGYRFAGWTAEGVDLADAGAENVTFTMPANDVTLTAEWDYIVTPGDPTYRPIIDEPENGSVTTSPSRPEAGDTVTVNPEPDEGYEVDEIIVTDKDGNPVEVTRNPDGSYSFTQPEGAVTIEVTFRPASGLPFTDVAEGDWFYDYVEYVYENGLMDGTSDTTFEPNANMTRAMVWAILARIDGETVTGANWVETAREWAMANGVSDGTDADGYVTREQLATMLWRYAGEPASDYSLSAFTDADSVSDYAATAMAWAVEHGIITGVTDTTLVPQGTATRAQCAAMLMRFVENVK